MGKPLGYFSLDVFANSLLMDIAETWGDGLDDLTEADRLWLIARIAHEGWQQEPTNSPPSEEAQEVVDRVHELNYHQKLQLLQALAQ